MKQWCLRIFERYLRDVTSLIFIFFTLDAMQSRLEKPASIVCQGRANGSGYNSSWTTSLAILHPGVVNAFWRGHFQTFLGLRSISRSRSNDSRSESIKRNILPSDSRNLSLQVTVIFDLMKKHVLRAIDGAQWASRETKLEAERKIERLHGNFVGTNMFFNYTFLQQRYGTVRQYRPQLFAACLQPWYFQVEINDDFFDNVLKMFRHFRQNIYHFINAPVDRETYTWNLISYPFTVNAFHLQQLNSIGKSIW